MTAFKFFLRGIAPYLCSMITYIKINGFKSFINFEAHFTPFTVIIGRNAAGKSNLFDALKLLARLAEEDLKTAFQEQRGNPQELFAYYGNGEYATKMDFVVEMLVEQKVHDDWGGKAKLDYTRLRYELCIEREKNKLGFEDLKVCKEALTKINKNDDQWMKDLFSTYKKQERDAMTKILRPKSGNIKKSFIQTEITDKNTEKKESITLSQDGTRGRKKAFSIKEGINQTVLSSVNTVDFKHAFAAREEMRQWNFWQLNPEALREPTAKIVGIQDKITPQGDNLASVMFRMTEEDRYNQVLISRKLNSFLPSFTEVNVYDDHANKQYIIKLKGEEEFSSRVLSEGTLRILALCILRYDNKHKGLICFEEPENGIHPFRIEFMANLLHELSIDLKALEQVVSQGGSPDHLPPLRQVIVNTHSMGMLYKVLALIPEDPKKEENIISIWMAESNTLLALLEGKPRKMMITKATPVSCDFQVTLPFARQENSYTVNQVREILCVRPDIKSIEKKLRCSKKST